CGRNGCQKIRVNSANTAADAGQRHHRRESANDRPISAATNAMESHSGGSGMRQLGSQRTCHAATCREATNRNPAIRASHDQPVKIAANPNGTTSDISGTIIMLAERPENEMRWK